MQLPWNFKEIFEKHGTAFFRNKPTFFPICSFENVIKMHISIHGETEKDILDFKVEKLIKRAKQNILFARIKIFSTYQGLFLEGNYV